MGLRLMWSLIPATAALLLTAGQPGARPRPDKQAEAREAYSLASDQARAALMRYRHSSGCSTRWETAIIQHADFAGRDFAASAPGERFAVSAGTAQSYAELGDAALKKGCLDEANVAFRYVLDTYLGTRYADIRQRAQSGLGAVQSAMAARTESEARRR